MSEALKLARQYDRSLPPHVREYLQQVRGISPEIVDLHLLGWNGSRITIPIFDRTGQFAFFKLAKGPNDQTDSPKMLASPGAHAELYGWERVLANPEQIIVCEGSSTGWCWKAGALRRSPRPAARSPSDPSGPRLCEKSPLYICASITTPPGAPVRSGWRG